MLECPSVGLVVATDKRFYATGCHVPSRKQENQTLTPLAADRTLLFEIIGLKILLAQVKNGIISREYCST